MSDNFPFTPGSGATGAADDVGGVLYPRVKLTWGPDGTANDADTAAGKAVPVQLRDSDGTDVGISTKLGSVTETAPATDTASSGLNGRLQRIAQRLTSLIALLPTSLGAGGGLKVDGSGTALPVSAASLPLPAGAATEGTLSALTTQSDFDTKVGSLTETAPASDTASSGLNGRLQRIAQRLTALIALLPTAIGQTTKAGSLGVTLASDDDLQGKIGSLTETAPASDTASSGLNGRLQRIAQRLTSLIALVPAALTGSGNFKVALVEDTTTNKSVNLAQVGGNSLSTGNGVAGTGTPRVTISSDSTPHQVAVSHETGSIYSGTTALTPKSAVITASSSGATTIVSAVASKKIRVVAMSVIANAAVNVKWQSHVTPTDKTGLAYLGANGGYILPFNPVGWFETVAGEALDINLSGAVAVGGHLTYVEI